MTAILNERSCGVLLHPTSLPGPAPHGEIGPEARAFIDFLAKANQRWWQMLPIHPPGGGDSPYDSPSAFAGSEYLISLTDLVSVHLLDEMDLKHSDSEIGDPSRADFERGRERRAELLKKAFLNFPSRGSADLQRAYNDFEKANNPWVWDYALFMALREDAQNRSWVTWPEAVRKREPQALKAAHAKYGDKIRLLVFCQFLFHHQWQELRVYAASRNVLLMGDIPMFVSHDSVDVWANQEMFFLDESGERTVQAGVPPDYFTELGQLWGNPLYRWDKMKEDDFGWWVDRLRRELNKFDAIRLDHFIAFSRYWEVPMGVENAKEGRFVGVPGHEFFASVQAQLGSLPFVAEDLGLITEAVEQLRDKFDLPGMKVLHFAFSKGAESLLPDRHPENSVTYLGTHDNDTTRGWYRSLLERKDVEGPVGDDAREQIARIFEYTKVTSEAETCPRLLEVLMASRANTAILTVPDLLNQGSEGRMNVPGIGRGNWTYRFVEGALTDELADRLRAMVQATDRRPRFD
jgi:4-alpha-glucanotransferase